MSEVNFSDRHPKYKHFTLDEWNLKYSFSYDDRHGFSDSKLFDMQNSHRFYSMMEDFGLPCDSSSFCNTFSKSHRRNKLIQRHLCSKSCYWQGSRKLAPLAPPVPDKSHLVGQNEI